MTDTLDDLERTIADTLATKADQLVVDDVPFAPLDDGPSATVIHLTPPRPSRRRVLAVAAVVAVLAAGAAVVGRLVDDGPDATVPASGAAVVQGTREAGPIAILPADPPPGWQLASLDVGTTTVGQEATQWQLFAPSGATPPLVRGVLVSSASARYRLPEGAERSVQGRPVAVSPSTDPAHPVGAVTARWIEGGAIHDVVAVGLPDDELVAFLDALMPRADPITGVDPPAGAALIEVGSATAAGGRSASATYTGPDGPGDVVRVSATSVDPYGGLLHRVDGRTDASGTALVRRLDVAGPHDLLSVARADGWTVDVVSQGSTTARAHPSVLSDLAATLQPVTRQQAVDLGLAEPVTATYELAGGQTVEVHGTAVEDVALCLTTPDDRTCGTAESLSGPAQLTTASLVLRDRWVIVAVSATGPGEELVVQTVPGDPRRLDGWEPAPVDAVTHTTTGDGAVAGLHQPPTGAEAVEVMVSTDTLGSGFTYVDPLR